MKEKSNTNKRRSDEKRSSSFLGAKFWVLTLTLIVVPAFLLAKFSLIKINLNNPINAKYIELVYNFNIS